jgi:hypothetical protein
MIQVGSIVRHVDKEFDKKIGVMQVIEIKKNTYAVCSDGVQYFFPLSELKLA